MKWILSGYGSLLACSKVTCSLAQAILFQVWFPMTVATNSFHQRQILSKYLLETVDDDLHWLPCQMIDFGFREASSVEVIAHNDAMPCNMVQCMRSHVWLLMCIHNKVWLLLCIRSRLKRLPIFPEILQSCMLEALLNAHLEF